MHVLGMPPAFVLSQDQTLKLTCLSPGNSRSSNPSTNHITLERTLEMRRSLSSRSSSDPAPPAHPFHRLHLSNSPANLPSAAPAAAFAPSGGRGFTLPGKARQPLFFPPFFTRATALGAVQRRRVSTPARQPCQPGFFEIRNRSSGRPRATPSVTDRSNGCRDLAFWRRA